MVNEPPGPLVTEQQLPEWLLRHVPALTEAYSYEMALRTQDVIEGYTSDPSPTAYFVLSWVLKPHIEALLDRGDENELQRILDLLEYLAQHGDASIQNELVVTMEEIDVWRVWPFLGSRLRARESERVTWLPEAAANAHVDRDRYRQRWQEEIENIGGWEHLTDAHQMWIRYRLVEEFGIVGLRAPEPGGAEWRANGLVWPLPNDAA